MRIRVLGAVGVQRAPGDVTRIAATKPATVLGLLAVNAGTVVSETALTDGLWPHAPPHSARTALQTYISQVRSLLQPDRPRRSPGQIIATVPDGYVLTADRTTLDAAQLDWLAAEAVRLRVTDPPAAAHVVAEALDLWEPPLAGLSDRPWARAFVARMEEVHRSLVEERFALALLMGSHADIVDELRPAIAADPYRERLVGQLMLALYRCGRQGEALDVYGQARRRLIADLGVEPGRELSMLHRAVLAADGRLDFRGGHEVEAGVPIPSRSRRPVMVGRDDDLAELRGAVRSHRLVSVVGPGGVGKTRLVHELLASGLPSGWRTWFVDLAAVATDEEVLQVIARVLHLVQHPLLPLADQLVAAFDELTDAEADRPGHLLVLDTCERVRRGVAGAVEVLLRNPDVRVLCTSRTPIRLRDEHVQRVAPLPVAGRDGEAAGDAVRLLSLRSGITDPDPTTRAHLQGITRRVDGIPLAIELAAARVRTIGPAELERRLTDDLGLLDGPEDAPTRHRTVVATVQWSTDLLDDRQRLALVRAAAFAGPFTATMAEQVLADDDLPAAEVVSVLISLADASLLAVEHQTVTTTASGVASPAVLLRVLDTVRAVARRRMLDPVTREGARERHLDWVLRTVHAAQHADRDLRPPELPLEAIPDEISAAFDELERRPGDPRHLALAAGLGVYYKATGRLTEGRQRIGRALSAASPDADPRSRAAAMGGAAYLAFYQGSFVEGARLTTEAARIAQQVGRLGMASAMRATTHLGRGELHEAEAALDTALAAYDEPSRARLILLDMAAQLAWHRGDHRVALERFRDAADLADQAGNDFVLAQALRGQGVMLAYLGDPERGWGLCTRALGIATRRGDDLSVAQSHAACAAAALEAEVELDAREHAVDALRRSVRQFDVFALLVAVPILALIDTRRDAIPRAGRLVGWYRGMTETTRASAPRHSATQLDAAAAAVRSCLGRAEAARLQAAGAAMPVSELTRLP